MSARRRAWREVRAIAALEALDGLRARRQLVVRTLTPIVLFVCVMGVSIGLRGADTRTHTGRYMIAVEGDIDGARATLAAIAQEDLAFEPSADARLATIADADTGLRVPDGLDEKLRVGGADPVPVELFQVTSDPLSRAAAVVLQSRFVDLHTREVRDRLDAERSRAAAGPGSFRVDATNVERTVAGTRSLTSQVIPGLLCLQAALLVAGTANRLVSRRTRGLLTTQLLLPVSRRGLAVAKGLGELVVGTVSAAPVVLALLGFGAVIVLRDGTPLDAVVHTVATAVALVALFALTTSVGVVIGTAARTQEQVSLATGAAVIAAALVATIVALGVREPPSIVAAIPFAGIVGALRQVLNGAGSPLVFAVATATTVLGALAVSALAGRSLDAERLVLRNG